MKHIYDNQDGNQNQNNKSSDELFTQRFKEVATSYEPAFNPADWSAMQSKLDIHNQKDRKAVVYRRLATFATMGAAAILLLFFGYKFLDKSANKISTQNANQQIAFQESDIEKEKFIRQNFNNQNSTNDKTNTKKENLENANSNNNDVAKIESNSSSTISTKIKNGNRNLAKNKNSKTSQSNLSSNSASNFTENSMVKNDNSVSTNKTAITPSFNSDKETESIESSLNLNGKTAILKDNETIEEAKSNRILIALKLEKPKFDLFSDVKPEEVTLPLIEIDENLLADKDVTESNGKNKVVSAIGKWRIGATLMAMVNVYKSNDKQRMNYTNGYGVMADYQVARRFNISAGAIYTQKQIDLEEPLFDANDFNPSSNDEAWVKKNKTKINWRLIDLPLQLRYNAVQTQKNKWFVTAGTSNYFFLKENYESDYTVSTQDIYDPRVTRTQEVVRQRETQSALQLFATINVSVGLETSLGKHLTLQVEPYWRFPVRSLGSEGVFVQTGGLLTRINFAL